MENLNLIWQEIYAFLSRQENLFIILLLILYVVGWGLILWKLISLPRKIRKIKKRGAGWIIKEGGISAKVRKIKI